MDDAPLPAPAAPAPAPAAAAPRVPFHCSECGKSFRYRSDLRRHFARHTALKPHACPRCGKGFKHSFNLANHLRSHTGERPYRCSACPKGFRDSTGLLHHQLSALCVHSPCVLLCLLGFLSEAPGICVSFCCVILLHQLSMCAAPFLGRLHFLLHRAALLTGCTPCTWDSPTRGTHLHGMALLVCGSTTHEPAHHTGQETLGLDTGPPMW